MSTRALALLSYLVLASCTPTNVEQAPARADTADKPDTADKSEASKTTGAPKTPNPAPESPWDEPERDHLLLLAHDDTTRDATLRPIALGGGAKLLSSEPVPTIPIANWPDHFMVVVVAGHGGEGRFVVARGDAAPWHVDLRELGQAEPAVSVAIGDKPPAALHMVGAQAFIGQGNMVATIDFAAAESAHQQLRERANMGFKAYDLFARDGDWLIAIDDVVTPIYADSFDLHANGAAQRAGFELPGAINGHYQHAVLDASAKGQGTVYAIVGYGIMSGHGHDLAAVPMRDDAVDLDVDEVLINGGGESAMPIIEEHVSRVKSQPSTLVAGDTYTDWTGLAWLSDPAAGSGTVLVAAGSRGLLAFAGAFESGDKPTVLDLGGPCLDVLTAGPRAWALLGDGGKSGPAVVEFELERVGGKLRAKQLMLITLDESYRSFVR